MYYVCNTSPFAGQAYLSAVRSQLGVPEDGEFSLPSKAVESLVEEYDNVQEEAKEWKVFFIS